MTNLPLRGVMVTAWMLAAASALAADSIGDNIEQSLDQPATGTQATADLPANYAQTMGAIASLQARPDVYMLSVGPDNITVETGVQGTVVVDTTASSDCAAIAKVIKQIAVTPIRYVIDTSADPDVIGCNGAIAQAGEAFAAGPGGSYAPIIAYQTVLLQMLAQPGQHFVDAAVPSETFTRRDRTMYMNGQGIDVRWMPAAHSSGDSVVLFRGSDLVAAGDILDETRFPKIETKLGGSINGEIAALNELLEQIAIPVTPRWFNQYGTLIVPSRGHLADQADVLNYRDMVTIIRDRVQHGIDQHETLDKVLAQDPAKGYESRYGADQGDWTTKDFITAVYSSLQAERRARPRTPEGDK